MAARQNNNKVNTLIIPLGDLHSNDAHLAFYDGTSTVGLLFGSNPGLREMCFSARAGRV